jgi:hypothetical protein
VPLCTPSLEGYSEQWREGKVCLIVSLDIFLFCGGSAVLGAICSGRLGTREGKARTTRKEALLCLYSERKRPCVSAVEEAVQYSFERRRLARCPLICSRAP